MTRVLLTGPKPSGKGGVSVWVGMVLDYLHSNKTDVELDLLDVNRSASLTHLLPIYKRMWYSVKDYTRVLFYLRAMLRKKKYDVVHISSSGKSGILRDWLFMKMAKWYNAKVVVHYHCGTIPEQLKNGGILAFLLRGIAKKSDLIALDEATRVALVNEGFKNVHKIGNPYNPIIDSIYSEDVPRNDSQILFVGHVVHEKGIRELLEAITPIKDVTLKCFGPENKQIKEELNQYIEDHNLGDRVKFHGLQPVEVIYQEMRGAGLFVLPTYTEGFPFVIVEAMASGCPIISTPVGAIEEMLTDKNGLQGYLVPVKDADCLKKNIENYLNNKEEAKNKALNARKKAVEEYSVDAIMNKLINLWSK